MTATTLRLPDELYQELKRLAAGDDRSVNNLIVRLLRLATAGGKGAEA